MKRPKFLNSANDHSSFSQNSQKVKRLNFFLQIITNALTKLADSLSDVKTVLPWVMSALNVPVWLISLIVPLRESGSLLPQLWVAPWIKSFRKRQWIWIVGGLGQALALALIIFFALSFNGFWAGIAIVVTVILFSLFRSLCSITSKDIMGRTVPKMSRGQLNGWSSSIAGGVTLLTGLFIIWSASGEQYAIYLLGFAVVVWLIAALIYSGIRDSVDTENQGRSAIGAISLRHLIADNQFRYFVIVRTLLLSTALSAPFYTLLLQQYYPQNQQLGFLLIVSSLAGILSGPLWGRMADWSSRRVLLLSALINGLSGVFMLAYVIVAESISPLVLLGGFFITLLTHQGVRLGRKTYLVDMATGDKRTDYVATSNTLIGVMLLVCAGIGLLVDKSSVINAIAFLAILSLLASVLTLKLPEVEVLAKKNVENTASDDKNNGLSNTN